MARDGRGAVPRSSFYVSQRLRLHFVDWGNEQAAPLVLIHGGRDHARSWDPVARELRRDFHVIAADLRGHGDSAHPTGGGFAMPELVLDVAQLVESLGVASVSVIGHSLGGAIALHFAGVLPERVRKLVAIEGLGPAPELRERMLSVSAPERLRGWIEAMRDLARRVPRRYASLEDAAARMREANAHLSPELALHLTRHGVARNDDGSWSWKFDNAIHAPSSTRPDFQGLEALWANIACPVLLVRGTESWASDPEKDGRIRPFRNARLANVEGAGHWVHHDRPDEFLRLVRGFLADPEPSQG